jgi:hypothetical protein
MSDESSESLKVPFGTWNTFKTFVKAELKEKTIPPKIDTSLFKGKSGTDGQQLRRAFRFFGYVTGPEDRTTDKLRSLVQAYGTDEWKQALTELLRSYSPIVSGVDLQNGSQKDLEDAFRSSADMSGSTLIKAVRLYLQIAAEAGIKLSPHFVTVRGIGGSESGDSTLTAAPTNGSKPKRKKPARSSEKSSTTDQMTPDSVDEIRPLPDSDFRVWIPKAMPKGELDFALKYLRDYLKLRRPDQGGSTP